MGRGHWTEDDRELFMTGRSGIKFASGIYRGQFQRPIGLVNLLGTSPSTVAIAEDPIRVSHFPVFLCMIYVFRSHKKSLSKDQCQFLKKTYTLLMHLTGAFWSYKNTHLSACSTVLHPFFLQPLFYSPHQVPLGPLLAL